MFLEERTVIECELPVQFQGTEIWKGLDPLIWGLKTRVTHNPGILIGLHIRIVYLIVLKDFINIKDIVNGICVYVYASKLL